MIKTVKSYGREKICQGLLHRKTNICLLHLSFL